MNMTLYGICFKLRGGPDLLDYVRSNKPLPVDVMGQVMEQMNAVTPAEMAFAERLQADWIKAMNERVPLLMSTAPDGSYDITCTVPDEMLETVKLLTGKEYEQIVGDYTAAHLKDVCGINAEIVSVDIDTTEEAAIPVRHTPLAPAKTEPAVGFDLSALEEMPEGPAFEDLTDIDVEHDIEAESAAPAQETPIAVQKAPEAVKEASVAVQEEPVAVAEPEEDYSEEYPEEYPEEYSEEGYEDQGYEDEGYEDQGFAEEEPAEETPVEEAPAEEEAAEEEVPAEDNGVQAAVAGIYKEMVTNIRDRKLDERLGLRIGQ